MKSMVKFSKIGVSLFLLSALLWSTLIGINLVTPVNADALPSPLIFEDDFENYTVGTFPYAGGWELRYSGAGSEYQIIVDNVSFSPTKSLQLLGWGIEGGSHLAAIAAYPFSWSSTIIGYSVYVRVDDFGTFDYPAGVGFAKRRPSTGGHAYCNPVRFYPDGVIYTRVAGGQLISLQPYEPDTWYKVEAVLDTTTDTFSVWIDDELKGSGFNAQFPSSEIESFILRSGYPNVKAYFDDVKLYEAAPTPHPVIDRAFVSDDRADVGSVQTIGFHAKWDNGSNVVGGDIYVNGTKYITNSTGWISFNDVSSVVDRKTWVVTGVNCSGVTVYVQTAPTPSIIWDQIKIVDGGVTKESVMVGETATIWFQATYEYDDITFDDTNGILYVNGSEMSWSTANRWEYNYTSTVYGPKAFIVTGVSDSLYGLTVINDTIGAQTIIVLGQPTLTVALDSSTTYVGYKVKISGNLTHPDGNGISGARLLLAYSVTGGESWNDITSVTTTAGGEYFVEWMPTATGNYLVRVSWEGNETLYVAGTEAYSTLAVTPVEGKYVFSVISNSTVSELAFNSTSRVLSFTVSGPSGTIGYTKVTIAKTLIGDISKLKVYLDGNQINYTVTSTEDSFLLYFTYQHSTHEVVVSLGPPPFIPPQLITPLSLGILAVALAVATAIFIFKIRKGTPTTILDSVLK